MATYYPHQMSRTATSTSDGGALNRIVGRAMARSREFWCGLSGHDNLMHFEKERLYLQCASCGHESPGWELNEAPPKVVLRGDARRHALVRPRLIGAERRIA